MWTQISCLGKERPTTVVGWVAWADRYATARMSARHKKRRKIKKQFSFAGLNRTLQTHFHRIMFWRTWDFLMQQQWWWVSVHLEKWRTKLGCEKHVFAESHVILSYYCCSWLAPLVLVLLVLGMMLWWCSSFSQINAREFQRIVHQNPIIDSFFVQWRKPNQIEKI
jgi:hypothetical protein